MGCDDGDHGGGEMRGEKVSTLTRRMENISAFSRLHKRTQFMGMMMRRTTWWSTPDIIRMSQQFFRSYSS
jgi:hypothetical protein